MADLPRIGVVTVLFNSAAVLPEFFTSIYSQGYPSFTVFAVDNASQDDSVAICAQHAPLCTVIANPENRGVAAANNQGIAAAIAAGGDLVVLLNNDVRCGPELFAQLVEGLHTQNCEMTAPMIYFADSPGTIWCAGGSFDRWLGYRQHHIGEGEHDTGQFAPQRIAFAPTCCVLMRREVFERVGRMDERYFVYWDDTDWMLRAHRAGVVMWFLPEAKLWHKVGALTGRQSGFTLRYATRNHAFYLRKHLAAPLALFWLVIYAAGFAAGAPFSSRRRSQLAAWFEGWRMPL